MNLFNKDSKCPKCALDSMPDWMRNDRRRTTWLLKDRRRTTWLLENRRI